MNKLQLLVSKAKRYVRKVDPYLASILYQTPVYGVENMRGIASTNGMRININSRYFLDSCDTRVLAFVLAHEAKHIDLRSMLREKGRNHHRWNEATDYAINIMLDRLIKIKREGNEWMRPPTVGPDGGKFQILINADYEGLTSEDIYAILSENKSKDADRGGMPPSSGNNRHGEDADSSQNSENAGAGRDSVVEASSFDPETGLDGEADEKKVFERIEAVVMGVIGEKNEQSSRNGWGSNSGGRAETVSSSRSNQLDWRMVVRRSLGRLGKPRQDPTHPSRRTIAYRSLGQKFYFPKMKRQARNRVMAVIDTSGSVSLKSAKMFLGEISNCLRTLPGTELRLYCCDTDLKFVGEYRGCIPSELELSGWGGTSFEPAFRELKKLESEGKKMQLLAYFTDGYCSYPALDGGEPKCEVLWCLDNKNQADAPFGRTVRIAAE